MRYELKSIGVWAFIKVAFIVNLLAGLIGGVFAIPFAAILMALTETAAYSDPELYYPEEGALGALVVGLPFLCGLGAAVAGTFFQLIVILMYNLITKLVGGFELVLQPAAGISPAAGPAASAPSQRSFSVPPPPPPPASGPPSAEMPPPTNDVTPQPPSDPGSSPSPESRPGGDNREMR